HDATQRECHEGHQPATMRLRRDCFVTEEIRDPGNLRTCKPQAIPPVRDREEHVMATGTVKWFNPAKGFGFIQPDQGGPDVFVHISAVEQAGMSGLNEGQKIQYEVIEDKRKGKSSAGNLKVI